MGWPRLSVPDRATPRFLTVRARERLEAADLVLFDGLVPPAIVRLAARAERVSVARRAGPKALTQEEVSARIIAGARAGKRFVRLRRATRSCSAAVEKRSRRCGPQGAFEIVPGLSTALVAPALAGIPVTYRGMSAAVVIVSGHAPESYEPILRAVPAGQATIVVLMGLRERRRIGRGWIESGWKTTTPVAIVLNASQRTERIWKGRLASLGGRDDQRP